MQNFTKLNDTTIQLSCGIFGGVTRVDCYPSGELRGVRLDAENKILTHAGELTPAFTETHRRKNKYPVEFHPNGMLKAVALNEMQEITTPIGEFPAELVTFYDTGELNRFFPLDGQISATWSEEDEKALSFPLNFEFPFGKFAAIIGGIAFFRSGDIRSITLFPNEIILLNTAAGEIPVRCGFSLYKTGALKSVEPAKPISVQTPIGEILAFDPHPIGVHADRNSLVFDKQNRITSLITVHNRVGVQTQEGALKMFSPTEILSPHDDETTITRGMKISFDYENSMVIFGNEKPLSVNSGFTIAPYSNTCHAEMYASCTSHKCTGCGRHRY